MGRAVDLFVTYRFLKLLTTPFNKTDAFKFGIIDKDGNRIKNEDGSVEVLRTPDEKGAYTILHKLIFNIKKLSNHACTTQRRSLFHHAVLHVGKNHVIAIRRERLTARSANPLRATSYQSNGF